MDKRKIAVGKSGTIEKTNQASTSSKSTTTHQQTNVQMVQSTLLIWLDNNIDENSADYRNTITQFRRMINSVNTFTDCDKCIQFIERMKNEKAHMIISGSLGEHIVPRIHDMSQVDSIFIFCGNKKRHEQWARDWTKIKGVFTEIPPIYEALKQVAQQDEQDKMTKSSVNTTGSDITFGNVDQLDPSFMYTQILKEILLSIKFEQKHIKEFIDYCRTVYTDNDHELRNVDKLEREYQDHTPIWWYTCDCFLYAMVNRALRSMEVDTIIKMGFYIADLDRHIEQLHSKQFKERDHRDPFIVYRVQGLSKEDFERLSKTKGGLLAFNNFLSTQPDHQMALKYLNNVTSNPNLVGILFVMKIDPSQSTTVFTSIDDFSCFSQEKEVLFSMHAVFRIGDIKPIGKGDRLFQVDLKLTSDTDHDLHMLTDHLRKEICQHSNGWYQLGLLTIKMGQFDAAQHIYQCLLKETPDEREKGNLYHQIGSIKVGQNEYKEAITYFDKALIICEKTLPPNHPHLASSYNNIGLVYDKIGEYLKALEPYEKALKIYQKIRPPNHPDLVSTYNNMGSVYNNTGEYSKALSFHEKALEIQKNTLPPNHPDLAMSYYSIGLVYGNIGEFSKAVSFHERAVNIAQISLPSNHPALQMYTKNLDSAKKKS